MKSVRTGYGWPILLRNASLGNQIQASLVMVHLVESDDCQFLQNWLFIAHSMTLKAELALGCKSEQVEESFNGPWRTELTYVAKYGDDLWLGVKGPPNSEIAGFPRNLLR